MTNQQVEDLLNDLFILKPNSVLFKSIDGIHQKTTTQYSVMEIGEEVGSGTESFEEKRRIFIKTISIRECDQDRLEIKTRGQSGNPSWFEFRKRRLTLSLHHANELLHILTINKQLLDYSIRGSLRFVRAAQIMIIS